MEAYAKVSDLECRWRTLDPYEKTRAEVLLVDAAVIIASAMKAACVVVDPDDQEQAANLVRVSCSMVQRAMAQGDGEQEHAWGGELVMNPSGDLYLSKSDKKSLGIIKLRVASNPMGSVLR